MEQSYSLACSNLEKTGRGVTPTSNEITKSTSEASLSADHLNHNKKSEVVDAVQKVTERLSYPFSQPKTTIRFTVSELSSLKSEKSAYQNLAELPWCLLVTSECSKLTNNVKCFGIFVECNANNESTIWSCRAAVKIRLISQKSTGAAETVDHTREFIHTYKYDLADWGYRMFIKWSEITDSERGFVHKDKVTVEAEITILNVIGVRQAPIFDFTHKTLDSDGVLMIDGMRLFISKQYLALHSPVFHAMFYSDFAEREMKEIPIQDVILKEFVEFLNVFYPSRAPITNENVEYLLKLGDRFAIKFVIDECEQFLIKVNDYKAFPIVKRLLYADQYHLAKLHDVCIQSFHLISEIKLLKVTKDYRKFSDATKVALLERVLKFP